MALTGNHLHKTEQRQTELMISSQHRTIIFLAVLSALLSLLVLNKGIVTGSFDRVHIWHLFINYFEVGFVRRALVGTLLSLSGLHSLFDNGETLLYFVHGTSILLLVFLVSLHVLRNNDNLDTILKVMVFLSPAFIIQAGYLKGLQDIFVLLVATITILFVRNRYIFSLSLIIGILIHELYLFTIPAQLLSFYWKTNRTDSFDVKRFIAVFWLPMLGVVIASVSIFLFGRLAMSADEYMAAMERIYPEGGLSPLIRDGHFQLSSGIEANRQLAVPYEIITTGFWFLLLPGCYLVTLGVVLANNIDTWRLRLLFIGSALVPLFTSFIAFDVWRWFGMSANMSILLILLIATNHQVRIGRWAYPAIFLFAASGPLGSADLAVPFPMYQFVIGKIAL